MEKIDFKEILEDLGSKGGALEVLLKRAIAKKIRPVQKMNGLINVLREAVGHK